MTRSTRWLDDDEQHMWRQWTRFSAELAAELERGLQARSGLSTADFQVLAELSETERGRARVSDLAGSLQWEQSRTSHHLARMEKRGLVRRDRCASDGRGSYAVLTPEGRRTIKRAAPGHVDDVRRLVFDQLDAKEVEVMAGVLERLRSVPDAEG